MLVRVCLSLFVVLVALVALLVFGCCWLPRLPPGTAGPFLGAPLSGPFLDLGPFITQTFSVSLCYIHALRKIVHHIREMEDLDKTR